MEERAQYEEQTKEAKSEADRQKEKKLVEQRTAIVEADTAQIQVVNEAKKKQKSEVIAAQRKLEVAKVKLEAAKQQADALRKKVPTTVKKIKRRTERITRRFEAIARWLKVVDRFVKLGKGTIGAMMKEREFFDDNKAYGRVFRQQIWNTIARPKKMGVGNHPAVP